MTSNRIPVTILGATGAVGQKLVVLLAGHPWFAVRRLCASDRNAGRPYQEAVHWIEPTPLPSEFGALVLDSADADVAGTIAFSALEADAAETIEPRFAAAGYWVVTNARPFRLAADVPLIIPEINADDVRLVDRQRAARGWRGAIVANPNCSAIILASALVPLERAFGIEGLVVTTMQAVSGAGYPGVPSLDALGNVIPHIPGEEDKIERETCKILGRAFPVSAHAHRVPVVDGHTLAVSVRLTGNPDPADVTAAFHAFEPPAAVAALPSAPERFLHVRAEPDRPQPRMDAAAGNGMTVSIGRVRACPVLDIRFVAVGHNTVRGAAGAAILNAELLVARDLVSRPT